MARYVMKNLETQQNYEIWARDWDHACEIARYETCRLFQIHTIRRYKGAVVGTNCTHENTVLYRGEDAQEICLDCETVITSEMEVNDTPEEQVVDIKTELDAIITTLTEHNQTAMTSRESYNKDSALYYYCHGKNGAYEVALDLLEALRDKLV
jgi:hypothetical protein